MCGCFHRPVTGWCTTSKRGFHRFKQVVHTLLWTPALQSLTV